MPKQPNKIPASIDIDRVAPMREAAYLTGLCERSLDNAAARGEIKIIKLSPRRRGIRMSEIARFIDSRA